MAQLVKRQTSSDKVNDDKKGSKKMSLADYIAEKCGSSEYCRALGQFCQANQITIGMGDLSMAQKTQLDQFNLRFPVENSAEFIAKMIQGGSQ